MLQCQQWIERLTTSLTALALQEVDQLLHSMSATVAAYAVREEGDKGREQCAKIDSDLYSVADIRTQASNVLESYDYLTEMEVRRQSQTFTVNISNQISNPNSSQESLHRLSGSVSINIFQTDAQITEAVAPINILSSIGVWEKLGAAYSQPSASKTIVQFIPDKIPCRLPAMTLIPLTESPPTSVTPVPATCTRGLRLH